MIDPLLSLSTRAVSLIAFVLFVPVVASFRFAPGTRWAAYVGIFYHLAVFLLVFKLPAPEWARAAGYGWLLLDVAAGTLNIKQVQPAIAHQVRLGGHIFAGSGLSWRRCRARLRRSWWVCQLGQSFSPTPLRHPFCRGYGLARRRFSCWSGSRFLHGRMASDVFKNHHSFAIRCLKSLHTWIIPAYFIYSESISTYSGWAARSNHRGQNGSDKHKQGVCKASL